jgi:hypothetical protein
MKQLVCEIWQGQDDFREAAGEDGAWVGVLGGDQAAAAMQDYKFGPAWCSSALSGTTGPDARPNSSEDVIGERQGEGGREGEREGGEFRQFAGSFSFVFILLSRRDPVLRPGAPCAGMSCLTRMNNSSQRQRSPWEQDLQVDGF